LCGWWALQDLNLGPTDYEFKDGKLARRVMNCAELVLCTDFAGENGCDHSCGLLPFTMSFDLVWAQKWAHFLRTGRTSRRTWLPFSGPIPSSLRDSSCAKDYVIAMVLILFLVFGVVLFEFSDSVASCHAQQSQSLQSCFFECCHTLNPT
jgi:hypothetical protein